MVVEGSVSACVCYSVWLVGVICSSIRIGVAEMCVLQQLEDSDNYVTTRKNRQVNIVHLCSTEPSLRARRWERTRRHQQQIKWAPRELADLRRRGFVFVLPIGSIEEQR